MSSLQNYRFNLLSFVPLFLIFSSLSGTRTVSAEDPFVDEFDGPELDPSWVIFDNEGNTQEGFTGEGEYEIIDSQSSADAGLGRSMSGSGDFTRGCHCKAGGFFRWPSRLQVSVPGAEVHGIGVQPERFHAGVLR